ncbi:MAG: MATE family efflux transporter [Acidobacteriota bacterium]
MNNSSPRLINGPVGSTLIRLTFPMLIGIFSIIAFNLMDTWFVAKLGTIELAAMSFTFPVVIVIAGIAQGIGVGTASVISRTIGEGDHHKVQRITTDALTLSLIIVVSFLITGILTIDPLFRALGASPEILPLIKRYMIIWYPGVAFVFFPMVGNNAIRATGDTKTPALIMIISAIINLILDPLLIFGIGPFPRLELEGAAASTVFARFISMIISLRILHFREKMLTFARPAIKKVLESWKKILYIGLPASGINLIIPVSMGIITRFVAEYGPEAVAALGVSLRIEAFSLTIVMALSTVLTPFVGQNWGAKKIDRLKLAVKYSERFALSWGLLLIFIFILFGEITAGAFSNNPVVMETIKLYLFIVSLSYGFQSLLMLSGSVLYALNKPLPSAILSLIRMIVVYVPLAYIGSFLFKLPGIFWAASIANVISGTLAYLWVRKILKNL